MQTVVDNTETAMIKYYGSRTGEVLKREFVPISWRDWFEEVLRMYAIIETGGKQYKVQEGDVLFIERLAAEAGSAVNFDKVVAVSKEGSIDVGTPLVNGVSVDAKVLSHGKDKKIIVFKYKPKKGYRKKQGHRQPYTKVQIEKINA